uniref:Methyltransf_11 domain-containing protein n=1 Tax=Onchocerca volvulus TaxID=6282 RepID=A0A8R1TTM9_ONCVO
MDIEKQYVREAYRHLASHPDTACYGSETRKLMLRWINVQKFINQLPLGTIAIDIGKYSFLNLGCGEAKYYRSDCFFMDCDTCLEMLAQLQLSPMVDLQLADALNLPYRSNSIDAALLVSVLHHFTTLDRRKRALTEVARCLRPRGQVLICVWAFEQPNGKFPSQDVLVPCQLHHCNSISPNNHNKSVRFHMNSTREQRLIRDSIAVNFLAENATQTEHISLFHRIFKIFSSFHGLLRHLLSTLNECARKYYSSTPISGILRSLMRHNAIEQFSVKLAEHTIEMALIEALCITQQHNPYRFYHLFKKDELKALIAMIPSVRLVHLDYEHANWWAVVEKLDLFS